MSDLKLDHKEQEIARLHAEIDRLRALLRSALYHVEGEGDDTLATIIRDALAGKEGK